MGNMDKGTVEEAVSYEDGEAKRKGVVRGAEIEPDAAAQKAKQQLFDQVKEIVQLIRLDRADVLEDLVEKQQKKARDGDEEVLGDPFSRLGRALFDEWKEEGIDAPSCWLVEGSVGGTEHSWFELESPAEVCGEPNYRYLIDPYCREVSLIHMGCSEAAEIDFLVIKPWSPYHLLFSGERVDALTEGETAEESKR